MKKPQTYRSDSGKKLYAVRDSKGRFKDIQAYKRAHARQRKRPMTLAEERLVNRAIEFVRWCNGGKRNYLSARPTLWQCVAAVVRERGKR